MVIIGYQGIGKSSISNAENKCINLEPRCFWYNGERVHHWMVLYCETAIHLSTQGYTVFISGYPQVLYYMRSCIGRTTIVSVFPSIDLKNEWNKRLKDRATNSGFKKDFDAYEKAVKEYEDDIKSMKSWGGKWFEITTMDYNLLDIVNYLKKVNKKS